MTDTQQPTLPRPRTPGTEMAALDRFYTDVTWMGTIDHAGSRRDGDVEVGLRRAAAQRR